MTATEHERRQAMAKIYFGVVLLIMAIVASASLYAGRLDARDDRLAGCERGRQANATNSRGQHDSAALARVSGTASLVRRFEERADRLERLSKIDCRVVYPAPSVLPF